MKRRDLLLGAGALAAGFGIPRSASASTDVWLTDGVQEVEFPEPYQSLPEPDYELARLWWPDQRNVWTPIGWKDHYFRFNVLYNGTVICEPCPHWTPPRPHATRWLGQSFQLRFVPPFSRGDIPVTLPKETTQLWRLDAGHGIQGWRTERETPVLWTEFRLQQGLVIRQEIFAHIKGAQAVKTGIEPIYAWIRLSVAHVDELKAPEKVDFTVQLSKVYLQHDGRYVYEDGVAINVNPAEAAYPRALHLESSANGTRILEPDGKIRMQLTLPTGRLGLKEASAGVYHLTVPIQGRAGYHVDLLVPMLSGEAQDLDAEASLGFDGALEESESFWTVRPATASVFRVPEEPVNQAIQHGCKYAQVIAERDYVNGEYTFLTGSWGYDNLWSTPTSMTSHMFLDLLGYGECVAHHMELFRVNQGTVKPPGPSYSMSPGYFATPKSLTAFNWLSDHGAILLQASTHALLTDDKEFIAQWTEPIVKACDFIKNACSQTNHGGVEGLLPPAVATDELTPTQAIWSIAWNYKGLATAVRFLQRIKHPRAAELAGFAAQQKDLFTHAYRKHTASMPQWTDAEGKKYPKVPDTFTAPSNHIFAPLSYLDTGPMVLVWAGLMEASDPLMLASVKFFREGPNTKLYGYRPDPLDRAVLLHEISSGEPCYSWNTFHSWQLGDKNAFLEGMYSLFAGALSQQTYIGCEHRSGVQGNIFPLPMAFTLARLAVIDDAITESELHLLRLCPAKWVSREKESVFEKMPTLFGPFDLRFRLAPTGKSLEVTAKGNWRERPRRIVFHTPAIPGLTSVTINGRRYRAAKQIELKDL